jgi:acetone carboxylase gamma subunit
VSHPFRENLEVESASDGGEWIRCIHCGHRLCALGQDWKTAARRKTFAPTQAGPLMTVLEGCYVFEKIYCPACGVLLNADMVEEKHGL